MDQDHPDEDRKISTSDQAGELKEARDEKGRRTKEDERTNGSITGRNFSKLRPNRNTPYITLQAARRDVDDRQGARHCQISKLKMVVFLLCTKVGSKEKKVVGA